MKIKDYLDRVRWDVLLGLILLTTLGMVVWWQFSMGCYTTWCFP